MGAAQRRTVLETQPRLGRYGTSVRVRYVGLRKVCRCCEIVELPMVARLSLERSGERVVSRLHVLAFCRRLSNWSCVQFVLVSVER